MNRRRALKTWNMTITSFRKTVGTVSGSFLLTTAIRVGLFCFASYAAVKHQSLMYLQIVSWNVIRRCCQTVFSSKILWTREKSLHSFTPDFLRWNKSICDKISPFYLAMNDCHVSYYSFQETGNAHFAGVRCQIRSTFPSEAAKCTAI